MIVLYISIIFPDNINIKAFNCNKYINFTTFLYRFVLKFSLQYFPNNLEQSRTILVNPGQS